MSEQREPRLNSLRDLPEDIPPARDLWPQIEARLGAEIDARRSRRYIALRWPASFAALAAAVVLGVWIGRGLIPGASPPIRVAGPGHVPDAGIAAYVGDPRYVKARQAMLQALPEMLARLPPPTRAKVAASLATIHRSMLDIQAALGRDPGNALLQELLVDTCQDEMRVLTTVQEADGLNGEI
jgi:hypothetical protein